MKTNTIEKLYFDRELLTGADCRLVGVDEVGRGPLSGPVVTAAVVMPLTEESLIEGINDSKKLSEKKREALYELIIDRAIAYAICRVEPDVIDRINILQATRLCMKNSIEQLPFTPGMVLTDGNMTLDISCPQRSVVHGDALSYSIGAASILAKVYRDRLMQEYAKEYPQYSFDKNKGYGTAEHIAAIREYGLCPIHRRTFTTKF